MLVIGLTGGIGSGKSTVCKLFANLGIPIIESDKITRDLVKPGQTCLDKIVAKLGKGILLENGELNRRKLRDITFNNEPIRKFLEDLLHPLVRESIYKEVETFNSPFCIVDIPLLIESNFNHDVERILVIDCNEDQQIERAMLRDEACEDDIRKIIASQVSRETRLQHATDILLNTGDLTDLETKVKDLYNKYINLQS